MKKFHWMDENAVAVCTWLAMPGRTAGTLVAVGSSHLRPLGDLHSIRVMRGQLVMA